MLPLWIICLLTLWVGVGAFVCVLVARGTITERELAELVEAQRNIQRAIGY